MKKLLSVLIIGALIASSTPCAFATASVEAENTNTQSITETEPTAQFPQIQSITPVSDGLRLRWNEIEGAVEYEIYLKRDGAMGYDLLDTTERLSYTHKSLTNNTLYSYLVYAVDENGKFIGTHDMVAKSCKYYSTPEIKSATSTDSGIKIEWDAVEGVSNYKVLIKDENSVWRTLSDTTDNFYVHKNALPDKLYNYTVCCTDESGNKRLSWYDYKGIKCRYISMPEITKIENLANGSKITFSKISGASQYTVYVKSENSSVYEPIGTTADNFIYHIDLSDGKTYTYTVRALDKDGEFLGEYSTDGWQNTFLKEPTLTSATAVFGGMKVSWESKTGAVNYKIYVKANDVWQEVGTTTNTSFVHSDVISGNDYTYTVRCVSPDGKINKSSFSTKGVTGTYIGSPIITDVENLSNGTKVTWDLQNGASLYKLFYKKSDGSGWKTIVSTDKNYYTHAPLSNGDVFTYTVRACDENGSYISGYDSVGVTNTFLSLISFSSVENENGEMLLSWEKNELCNGYRIYRKAINSDFEAILDTTENACVDANYPADTLYTYSIRCIDENSKAISYHSDYNRYFYNGESANGQFTVDGATYNFVDGYHAEGYVTIDDKLYYYDKSGNIVKNSIVGDNENGYMYAGKDGVCVTDEAIQLAVDFVINHASGSTNAEKLRSCYDYLYKNYPYKRILGLPASGEDIKTLAINMFKEKKGNCYSYASAYACIAKVLGYDSRVITGMISAAAGGVTPHGWSEIYYNSSWLICDPNMQTYYPTSLSFYMQTYSSYPVKPLNKESTYTLNIENGKASFS